jgi:hypothetical protein
MDRDVFLEQLFRFQKESVKVVMGALAEVGAKSADEVKAKDRRTVLNICERRLPKTRKRHIVQGETFVGEDEFWGFRKHGDEVLDKYKVEKGGYGIERK